MDNNEYTLARVLGVYTTSIANIPTFVILVKGEGWNNLVLPIYIGAAEATSIDIALKGYSLKRPLTHDLMASIFETLGIKLEKVTLDAMIENIYTATLILLQEINGKVKRFHVDSRPSDSIALALRLDAPIYIAKRLKKYAVPEDSFKIIDSDLEV